MNDIWQLLGLDGPTDDLRAIKRAYAKAIKVARPDEHPEQFQAINMAYKQAQQIARHRAVQGVDAEPEYEAVISEPPAAPDTVYQDVEATGLEIEQSQDSPEVQTCDQYEPEPLQSLPNEEEARYEAMREAFSDLLDQVDSLLNRFSALSLVENWRFIERSPYLLDDEFNWQFGMALFERILQHNIKHKDAPGRRLRASEVFIYLDQFVDWSGREGDLIRDFGEQACRPYLNLLNLSRKKADPLEGVKGGAGNKKAQEDKYSNLIHYFMAGRLGRTFANMIDLGLALFLVNVVAHLVPSLMPMKGDELINSFLVAFMMFLVMESSPLQASPGKLLMGYRVVRKDMTPVPWWQNIWRIFCYTLATIGIKVTVWINLFFDERILHDRISGTMVVNMRKSYNKHREAFEVEL